MKVLVDTHVFLWWTSKPASLSVKARSVMAKPDNTLLFSVGSLWEIIIKNEAQRLRLPIAPVEYVRSRVAHCGMEFLPVGVHHVAAMEGLPWHHRDPFDRLLVAQALAEGVPILTNDKQIQSYDVQRIW